MPGLQMRPPGVPLYGQPTTSTTSQQASIYPPPSSTFSAPLGHQPAQPSANPSNAPPPPPPPKTPLYHQHVWPTAPPSHGPPQPPQSSAAPYNPNTYGVMPSSLPSTGVAPADNSLYSPPSGASQHISVAQGANNALARPSWEQTNLYHTGGGMNQPQYLSQQQTQIWPQRPDMAMQPPPLRPPSLVHSPPHATFPTSPPPPPAQFENPHQYHNPNQQPPPTLPPHSQPPFNGPSNVQGQSEPMPQYGATPYGSTPPLPPPPQPHPPLPGLSQPSPQSLVLGNTVFGAGYNQPDPSTQQTSWQTHPPSQYVSSYNEPQIPPGAQPYARPATHPQQTVIPIPGEGTSISNYNIGSHHQASVPAIESYQPPLNQQGQTPGYPLPSHQSLAQSQSFSPQPHHQSSGQAYYHQSHRPPEENSVSSSGNIPSHGLQHSAPPSGYENSTWQGHNPPAQTGSGGTTSTPQAGIIAGQGNMFSADRPPPQNTGFGFSSDWEHFGPPTEEEIDDTELFSSAARQRSDTQSQDDVSNPSMSLRRHQSQVSQISTISDPSSYRGSVASAVQPPRSREGYMEYGSMSSQRLEGGAPSAVASTDSVDTRDAPSSGNQMVREPEKINIPKTIMVDAFVQSQDTFEPDQTDPLVQTETLEVPIYQHTGSQTNQIQGTEVLTQTDPIPQLNELEICFQLEPAYQESLTRYLRMLQQEAVAPTPTEKLDVFKKFMDEELQLRNSLYGLESSKSGDPTITAQLQIPQESLEKEVVEAQPQKPVASTIPLRPSVSISDSYVVVVDPTDDSEYSPGGRPRMFRRPVRESLKESITEPTAVDGSHTLGIINEQPPIASISTPCKNTSTFASTDDKNSAVLNDTTSSYKAFQYGDSDYAAPSSVYRPYSSGSGSPGLGVEQEKQVRRDAQNRSSLSDRENWDIPLKPMSDTGSRNSISEVQHSRPSSKHGQESASQQAPVYSQRTGPYQGFAANIAAILPSSELVLQSDHHFVESQRAVMDSMPEDNKFASGIISQWEEKAKKLSVKNEKERRLRQEEQEERNNQLFNDNEIGYGDITALEEEFKRSELKRKAEEDEEEYETYVVDVFEPNYHHLQGEIGHLMEIFMHCRSLLDETTGGKLALERWSTAPNLSEIVDILMGVHQKIEKRHKKVFEAIAERDRRYKKTVLQPLYAAGEITRMKQTEKQFEDAEGKATLEFTGNASDRTKQMVDIIEQCTTRGVAENQNFLEDVRKVINQMVEAISGGQNLDGYAQLPEVLTSAQTASRALNSVSERLLIHFHEAVQWLNKADHEDLVAEARLKKPAPGKLERLEAEHAAESAKLSAESDRRLVDLRKDFSKVDEQIAYLLDKLQHMDEAGGPRSDTPDLDLEHQERLRRALEEAKRRNAVREQGPPATGSM